ncbi:MAG: hypothetical protein AAF939_06700 [Planctomycetota bacterium]
MTISKPNSEEIRRLARSYLTPPKSSFWKLSDDLTAVDWITGAPIAFHAELVAVLEPMVEVGLPNWESILLIMAATSDRWQNISGIESNETFVTPRDLLAQIMGESLLENPHIQSTFDEVLDRLGRLRNLDNDVRLSVPAKRTLMESIFSNEKQNRLSPEISKEVISLLQSHFPFDDCDSKTHSRDTLLAAINELSQNSIHLNSQQLRLRRETGFDEVILPSNQPVDDLSPTNEVAAQLIADLHHDELFAGIARVANHLKTAITIPRKMKRTDDLALGGVTDIANRGQLDQLLLTELANDDLTLSVRIAVKEAMYFRRETPPQSMNRNRILILDSGIRMWGIPRAIGLAVTLAMTANSDPEANVEIYAIDEHRLVPTDLLTRDGLTMQMERLAPELHPGQAFREIKKLSQQSSDQNQSFTEIDIVLVTNQENLRDDEFVQDFRDSDLGPIHIVSVDRTGMTRLSTFNQTGSYEVSKVQIDLEQLTASGSQLVDFAKRKSLGIPVILTTPQFPIRLSKAGNLSCAWWVGQDGVLVITKDGQLCLWDTPSKGGQLINKQAPIGAVVWNAKEAIGGIWYAVLKYRNQGRYILVSFDRSSKETEFRFFDLEKPAGFFEHQNNLFAVLANSVVKIDFFDLTNLQTIALPDRIQNWVSGRFFTGQFGEWYAVSTTEFSAELEHIPINYPAVALVDCHDFEGPICIGPRGEIRELSGRRLTFSYSPKDIMKQFRGTKFEVVDVSPCRSKFILKDAARKNSFPGNLQYSLESRECKFTYLSDFNLTAARVQVHERSTRRRYHIISILQIRHPFHENAQNQSPTSYGISLSKEKGDPVHIYWSPENRIHIGKFIGEFEVISRKRLTAVEAEYEGAFRLTEAIWNSLHAVLDSRGMLHLRSTDPTIPEMTFVLDDANPTVWTSDGRLYGDISYYAVNQMDKISELDLFETSQLLIQQFEN